MPFIGLVFFCLTLHLCLPLCCSYLNRSEEAFLTLNVEFLNLFQFLRALFFSIAVFIISCSYFVDSFLWMFFPGIVYLLLHFLSPLVFSLADEIFLKYEIILSCLGCLGWMLKLLRVKFSVFERTVSSRFYYQQNEHLSLGALMSVDLLFFLDLLNFQLNSV